MNLIGTGTGTVPPPTTPDCHTWSISDIHFTPKCGMTLYAETYNKGSVSIFELASGNCTVCVTPIDVALGPLPNTTDPTCSVWSELDEFFTPLCSIQMRPDGATNKSCPICVSPIEAPPL